MASLKLHVNGVEHQLDADPEMPLLWVLRDLLGLTGTKYGCGEALCGACTVHLDGEAVRSCVTPVGAARRADDHHHRGPVARRRPPAAAGLGRARRAAVRLLPGRPDHERGRAARREAEAHDDEIDTALGGNLCRCGTLPAHPRGRRTSPPASPPKGGAR